MPSTLSTSSPQPKKPGLLSRLLPRKHAKPRYHSVIDEFLASPLPPSQESSLPMAPIQYNSWGIAPCMSPRHMDSIRILTVKCTDSQPPEPMQAMSIQTACNPVPGRLTFPMPTPTLSHTARSAADFDTESLCSSDEEGSDECTSPSSHSGQALAQPGYTYSYTNQHHQGGANALTTYQTSFYPNSTNRYMNVTASGPAGSMVVAQSTTYSHQPNERQYTRESETVVYAQSPDGHYTRSHTNNSIFISGTGNMISFGSQTIQTHPEVRRS